MIMKRAYKFFAAFFLLSIFAGCEENEVDNNAPVEDMRTRYELKAYLESNDTKTSLTEVSSGMYKPVWDESDKIGVMVDGASSPVKYELSSGAGTSSGIFSGFVSGSSYVAYYPFNDALTLKNDVLSVNLPLEQYYEKDSFGSGAYPMIAVSSTETLDFMNLCSVLKVSITGSDMVESIVFKANDDNVKVSGNATVDTQFSRVPELVMASGALSKVTLVCNGAALNPDVPTDFHIVVPAQTYKGGFTIVVNTATGTMIKSTENDVVMERSQLRAVPAFEFKKESGPDPSTTLEGEGTSASPFLISSVENLMLFKSKINTPDGAIKGVDAKTAHYKQTEDISLASVCGEDIGNWIPIGKKDAESYFKGVYDGDYHRITDLYINAPEENYQGLFGYIYGVVCNLYITGEVTGNDYVGLLAGRSDRVENVFTDGLVEGTEFVGGVTGDTKNILGCDNSAKVIGGYIVGGISGDSNATVDQCINVGTVYGGSYAGGIVGYQNAGVMLNCVNHGNVDGTVNVGGVSGFTRQNAVVVNCLNLGDVSGDNRVGGVTGFCSNENDLDSAPTAVKNSLNLGEVSSDDTSTLGGACGYNNSLVANCYWIYDPEASLGMEVGVNTVEGGVAENNMSLNDAQMKGEDMINPIYVSGTDRYYDIVDALTAWAADNVGTYPGMCGWRYSEINGYPEISNTDAEKPSGGETEPVFSVSPSSFEVAGVASQIVVSVTTNMDYYISSLPDWIEESGSAETSYGFDHLFTIDANPDASSREGTIVFCSEMQNCVPVTVKQAAAPAQDEEWMYKEFWHRSLAMRFTADWCGYCPNMASGFDAAVKLLPDKLEVVNMHGSGTYECSSVGTLMDAYYVEGFPTGIVDVRADIPNYTSYATFAQITQMVIEETESAYQSKTGISFTSSLSGNDISVNVNVYSKETDDYKVSVLLLEDGITSWQADYINGDHSDYVHNRVLRLALSDIEGDDARISENTKWNKTYTGRVPSGCNTSNLRVLVYVQKPYGTQSRSELYSEYVNYGDYGDYYVDNSRSEKVGVEAVLQFTDDPELGVSYESKDYSSDGKVTTLQTASKGNGIDIVLMGDAFGDRQIADGTYDRVMRTAYEKFFEVEPYKSFKDHFNVYSVAAVSKHDFYGGETVFEGYFGEGTHVGGNDQTVFNYAQKAISGQRLNEALLIVMMNSEAYAGTCWMYYPSNGDCGNGVSVSYFPIGTDDEALAQVLHHEAGGHGFSKLWDEYAYEDYGAMPSDEIAENRSLEAYGWGKNVDYTSSWTDVKWAHFLEDSRYANDGLGVFEGACTYWTGAYRPTDNSIMRYNVGGFNAPSREAIYYRIHKLAYGEDWVYDYEDFVEYDAVNRSASASSAQKRRANYVEKAFVPTAPPVIIRHSWRDAVPYSKQPSKFEVYQERRK